MTILILLAVLLSGCSSIKVDNSPANDFTFELNQEKNIPCKCEYQKTKKYPNKNRDRYQLMAKNYFYYAIMSNNASNEDQYKVPGWEKIDVVEDKYGFYAQIYESEDKGKIVIAIQGSKDIADWKTNFSTCKNGQYNIIDRVFDKIINEYNSHKVEVTGHSLGGGLAINLALTKKNVDAIVFNPSAKFCVEKKNRNTESKIIVISESGEFNRGLNKVFPSAKDVYNEYYRPNYLGGFFIGEHHMLLLTKCMVAAATLSDKEYRNRCSKK